MTTPYTQPATGGGKTAPAATSFDYLLKALEHIDHARGTLTTASLLARDEGHTMMAERLNDMQADLMLIRRRIQSDYQYVARELP